MTTPTAVAVGDTYAVSYNPLASQYDILDMTPGINSDFRHVAVVYGYGPHSERLAYAMAAAMQLLEANERTRRCQDRMDGCYSCWRDSSAAILAAAPLNPEED